jgi:hypothetical protein
MLILDEIELNKENNHPKEIFLKLTHTPLMASAVVSSLNVNLIRSTADRITKCKPGDHFAIIGLNPRADPPPTQRDVSMTYFRLSLILHPDRYKHNLVSLLPQERERVSEAADKAFKMLAESKSFLCSLSKIKYEEERAKLTPVFSEPKTGEFSAELFSKTFSSHIVRERNPKAARSPRVSSGVWNMSPQYLFVAGGMKVTSPQERARVFIHPIPMRPKPPPAPQPPQTPTTITHVMARAYGCSADQSMRASPPHQPQEGVVKISVPRSMGIPQTTKDKIIRQVLTTPPQSASLSVWN